MSLDKAIAQGKEHRKNNVYPNPYCRNHGGCFFVGKIAFINSEKNWPKRKTS